MTLYYIMFKMEKEQPKDKRDTSARMGYCVLTPEEFHLGFRRINCSSMESLKAKLPLLRKELEEDANFLRFWDFMYRLLCASETAAGQQMAQAVKLSSLRDCMAQYLGHSRKARRFPMLDDFLPFLDQKASGTLRRDDWSMLLKFGARVKPDLSNYNSEEDSWPTVFDEFVDWQKKRAAAGGGMEGGGQ
jgi:DCN1-like protein 1/2